MPITSSLLYSINLSRTKSRVQIMATLSGQQVRASVRAVMNPNAPRRDPETSTRKRILSELSYATREPIPLVSHRVEHDDLVCFLLHVFLQD
jgi:hypothetical protein